MSTKRKVFGIGFQKTGTTSLGTIFDKLGYKTASYHQFRHLAGQDGITMDEITRLALEIAANIDAAKDTPWPLVRGTTRAPLGLESQVPLSSVVTAIPTSLSCRNCAKACAWKCNWLTGGAVLTVSWKPTWLTATSATYPLSMPVNTYC